MRCNIRLRSHWRSCTLLFLSLSGIVGVFYLYYSRTSDELKCIYSNVCTENYRLYTSDIVKIRSNLMETEEMTLSDSAFKVHLKDQTMPLDKRGHLYLQQNMLFDELSNEYKFVKMVIYKDDVLKLWVNISRMFYHYSSNNCEDLIKHVQSIKSTYNASCIHLSDPQHMFDPVPLEERLRSINIGLPLSFKQSTNISDYVLDFIHIFSDAMINTHGAVTSRNMTLHSYKCHDFVEGAVDNIDQYDQMYDEVFTISGHWGVGYYHNIVEDLPRIAPYIPFLLQYPTIKVHAGRNIQTFLQLLGLDPSRGIQGHVVAKIVYMPSAYPCGTSGILNQNLFAEYLTHSIQGNKGFNKPRNSIVLIRRTSPHRLFLNHKQIHQMLVKEATKKELTVEVFPDNPPPSLRETQKMFSRAVMVVGPHGAGLSNIVFCQPGTIVIEGLHHRDRYKAANTCYTSLALASGMRYHGVYFKDRDVLNHTAEDYIEPVQFYLNNVF